MTMSRTYHGVDGLPTISVAMATYEGAAHLRAQLDSLLAQARLPGELVVCDDQSTDATADIVRDFASAAPFPVHLHINPRRLGVTANFERAFSLCQGDYIAPCDQDDLWLPARLQRLAAHLDHHADCSLAFANVALMDAQGRITGQTLWRRLGFTAKAVDQFNAHGAMNELLRRNVVTGMAMLFRRSLLAQALPLPGAFIHDEWLALIAAATGQVHAEAVPLVRYRQHAGQQIGPAQAGLLGQYRHARDRMGAAYIDRQMERARLLVERLASLPGVAPATCEQAADRLAHLARRRALRSRWWRRLPGATALALRGEYRRFGYGWKSMAQDLLL